MDRRHDGVGLGGQKPKDQMRSKDGFRFGAAFPIEDCPDAGKGEQRAAFIERKPNDVLLLGDGIRLGRIFGET